MAVSIGSNIPALGAQRRLARATDELSRVYNRLSSGQRINSASDDAAGLAISSKLKSESKLFRAASNNINYGISAMNIIDGSLGEQSSILNRLLELAEQSANGTFSSSQRRSLNGEYQALVKEFVRLADTTSFNGLNLLRGDRANGVSELSIQVGINGNRNSRIDVSGFDTAQLSGNVDLRRVTNADLDDDGDVDGDDQTYFLLGHTESEIATLFGDNYLTAETSVNGVTRKVIIGFIFDETQQSFDLIALEEQANGTFLTELSSQSYANYYNKFWDTNGAGPGTYSIDSVGRVIGNGDAPITLSTGQTLSINLSALTFTNTQSTAIDLSGVESVDRARAALDIGRARLDEISAMRGQLGATLSRFGSALSLTLESITTREEANSRIADADIAADSAELTRQKILEQTATAILGQAKTAPEIALSLLRL